MAIEIIGSGSPYRLDDKRFPLMGVTFKSKCPHCDYISVVDGEILSDHLSFPMVNAPMEFNFYHDFCRNVSETETWEGHEWQEKIILRITVEPG